jgi:hypothetical protein
MMEKLSEPASAHEGLPTPDSEWEMWRQQRARAQSALQQLKPYYC